MSRLWDRGSHLDARIARFTVGRDPELDQRLLAYDALGSAAHGTMLAEIGILDAADLPALVRELTLAAADARAGRLVIENADEDGHTALEKRLTERLGDVGRRIHTGRSRNDQVIATLRLWGREAVLELLQTLLDAADLLLDLAQEHRETSIPGYTHTRQAMPSTLGLLFAAHAENLLDDVPWLRTAFGHLDRSPLGSASGYGVALPLDRPRVAELLGFSGGCQVNTLAVQNDRGKTEALVLAAAAAAASDAGRLAADLIWFSSEELGFVRLDDAVTTGSSIMPQKRNPDVLELIRAGAARVRSRQAEIGAVYGPLPAGYHRDLQLTKEPFLEGMQTASDILAVLQPALGGLRVDAERCRAALVPAIGATDAVYQRVAAGEPFREVYREVAANPEAAVAGDVSLAWRARTHLGAPGALALDAARANAAAARTWVDAETSRLRAVWQHLLPQLSTA